MIRESHIPPYVLWPALVLASLFFAVSFWWYVVLIGGNPYQVDTVGVFTANGQAQSIFRAGEMAAIKRRVCTTTKVGGESFPVLISQATGYRYPFPPSLVLREPGCRVSVHAYTIPNVPAGSYLFVNTIRYQNNLVGRDEYAVLPAVPIEVSR